MRALNVIQLSLICTLGCNAATAEQSIECDDVNIRVVAPEAETADQICDLAIWTKSMLEGCHLVQNQPLEILVQQTGLIPGLLAHYSPQNDQIVLPPPQVLFEGLAKDSAYRALPQGHLFNSFVVHEMAHAFFAKTRCGLDTCRAGHEYIAYAMQFYSLEEGSRALFLANFPSQDRIHFGKFSDFYHDLMPESFAADAWRHFSEPGNGCDFIGKVVSGDVIFSTEFE